MEDTGGPGEKHRPVASHWQTLLHSVVWSTPHPDRDSNSQHKWWQAQISSHETFLVQSMFKDWKAK